MKSTGPLIAIAFDIVPAHLVDDEHHDEFRGTKVLRVPDHRGRPPNRQHDRHAPRCDTLHTRLTFHTFQCSLPRVPCPLQSSVTSDPSPDHLYPVASSASARSFGGLAVASTKLEERTRGGGGQARPVPAPKQG